MTNHTSQARARVPRRSWTQMVGPREAREYLDRSAGNRNIRPSHVAALARTMASGGWGDSNDRIALSWDGTLLNGHHRLTAIISSGCTVSLDFVEGIDPASFGHMDRGMIRTHSDVIALAGYKSSKQMAAIAGGVWRLENGLRLDLTSSTGATSDEMLDVLARHPGIHGSVLAASRVKHVIANSTFGVLHYAVCRTMPEKIEEFTSILETGLVPGGANGNPAHVFRERVIRDNIGSTGAAGRGRITRAAVRAWNMFARGERCVIFKMDLPGVLKMPDIIGNDIRPIRTQD